MQANFALKIQLLPQVVERVLAVGDLAGMRNGDGWFTAGDVSRLFEGLRLPPAGNVSQSLKRAEDRQLVRRRSAGGWTLTPLGRRRILEIVGGVEPGELAALMQLEPAAAELGHVQHPLIPPQMAPQKWLPAILTMLEEYEFDRNIFCMTRYPKDGASDVVNRVIGIARNVAAAHGMSLHLASERSLDDDLWGNVAAHMWACRYGIALFEERVAGRLNENLLIEVGSMLVTGRRCALVRDASVTTMPTDFVGQIYKAVDFEESDMVSEALHTWLAVDLALGRCRKCPGRNGKDAT